MARKKNGSGGSVVLDAASIEAAGMVMESNGQVGMGDAPRAFTNKMPGSQPTRGENKLTGANWAADSEHNRGDIVVFAVRARCLATGLKDKRNKNDRDVIDETIRVQEWEISGITPMDAELEEALGASLFASTSIDDDHAADIAARAHELAAPADDAASLDDVDLVALGEETNNDGVEAAAVEDDWGADGQAPDRRVVCECGELIEMEPVPAGAASDADRMIEPAEHGDACPLT